jgi:hypothetical protein
MEKQVQGSESTDVGFHFQDISEYWRSLDREKYPLLRSLALLTRQSDTIPHGNADSERHLKWVANNCTKIRNKLGEGSLSGHPFCR